MMREFAALWFMAAGSGDGWQLCRLLMQEQNKFAYIQQAL
jgi:hypothetical protein